MAKSTGGGGNGGRKGGGGAGSTASDKVNAMGARMDAAYNRLSKRIDAIEIEQYRLNKESNHTSSKRRLREIDQRISELGRTKNKLYKQRTKIFEANPLTKKRENDRLDYALTR